MRSVGRLPLAAVAILILGSCDRSGGESRLTVQESGRVLVRYSMSQLQALPQVEVSTPHSQGAQIQKGPTVRSILEFAGATDVTAVRVEGRDPAQVLGAADLNDPAILNVTKRNTLKLTGTGLSVDRWVRDVTALVVNP
jgi:hypothetical protein